MQDYTCVRKPQYGGSYVHMVGDPPSVSYTLENLNMVSPTYVRKLQYGSHIYMLENLNVVSPQLHGE